MTYKVLSHPGDNVAVKIKLDVSWRADFDKNPGAEQLSLFFDYLLMNGIRMTTNGKNKGMIGKANLNAALLATWLGEKSIANVLKKVMLSADNTYS